MQDPKVQCIGETQINIAARLTNAAVAPATVNGLLLSLVG